MSTKVVGPTVLRKNLFARKIIEKSTLIRQARS